MDHFVLLLILGLPTKLCRAACNESVFKEICDILEIYVPELRMRFPKEDRFTNAMAGVIWAVHRCLDEHGTSNPTEPVFDSSVEEFMCNHFVFTLSRIDQ